MQDSQTLKAQIIALLDSLPAESLKLLAEFATFLRAKSDSDDDIEPTMVQDKTAQMNIETAIEPRQRPIRISSPRLVNRKQIADFKLEVVEEAPNDCL